MTFSLPSSLLLKLPCKPEHMGGTAPYSVANTLIENGSPLRSALEFVQLLNNTKFDK